MNKIGMSSLHRYRCVTVVIWTTVVTFVLLSRLTQGVHAQPFPPPGAGYLDYTYGPNVNGAERTPTESKPESKLWWNDGYWWGSMFSAASGTYHIYRLDLTSQTWVDTDTVLDNRSKS